MAAESSVQRALRLIEAERRMSATLTGRVINRLLDALLNLRRCTLTGEKKRAACGRGEFLCAQCADWAETVLAALEGDR